MKFLVKKILDNFEGGTIFNFEDSEVFILNENDKPDIRICRSPRKASEFEVMAVNGRIKITPESGNAIFIESTKRME